MSISRSHTLRASVWPQATIPSPPPREALPNGPAPHVDARAGGWSSRSANAASLTALGAVTRRSLNESSPGRGTAATSSDNSGPRLSTRSVEIPRASSRVSRTTAPASVSASETSGVSDQNKHRTAGVQVRRMVIVLQLLNTWRHGEGVCSGQPLDPFWCCTRTMRSLP